MSEIKFYLKKKN